jgi:hypothetical protein
MIRKNYKLFKDTQMQLEQCKRVIDDFLKKPTEALRRQELEDIFDEFDFFIERELLPVMVAWSGGCKATEYNKLLRNVKLVVKEKKEKWLKTLK